MTEHHKKRQAQGKIPSYCVGASFSRAWASGLAPRSQRRYLEPHGWQFRPRLKPAGSIVEVMGEAVDGSTPGAAGVVDGSTAGEVAGSTAVVTAVGVHGLIAGRRSFTQDNCMAHEIDRSILIQPAALAEAEEDRPFVAIVRSRAELCHRLSGPFPGLQWLQVEGLLSDPDAWASAARGTSHVPLDVVLSEPASEFSDLYRLVDVCAVRDVRVTMPAKHGFSKALKLAASLQLPARILPGQPNSEMLAELTEALEFYLHEPTVEVPVEFFHSLLASVCGADTGSLWMILEEDPATFLHYDGDGNHRLPRSSEPPPEKTSLRAFVESHLESLLEHGAECATCPWRQVCRGYFKWPDPAYSCAGVKRLFSMIDAAAAEIGRDLAHGEYVSTWPEVKAYERPNV
jgi:hypothetical protein